MKLAIVFFAAAFCAIAYARPDGYTTKYDNIDLQEIIKNDRLLRSYIDCLLGTKKCTNDGEELKKVLPDALSNDCSKCSDVQKSGSQTILTHLLKNKRAWYDELEAKYDPEAKYRASYAKKYSDVLKKEGIVL